MNCLYTGRNHCCYHHRIVVWKFTVTGNKQRERRGNKKTKGKNRSKKCTRVKKKKSINELFFVSLVALLCTKEIDGIKSHLRNTNINSPLL